MSNLQNRIEELEKLKERITSGEISGFVEPSSYLQLLNYHIDLLKEVLAVVGMIKEDNIKTLQEWYVKRSK